MKNEKVKIGITQYWARFTLGILSSVRELIYLPKSRLALIMGVLTLVFVVPVFNQGDLTHTVFTSHGYLKGHFLDFYDYNKPLTGGSDYLPILYIIFASWMGVYYIFGESSGSPISDWPYVLSPGELVWAKILLVLFFSLSVLLLFRIAKLIHPDNPRRQAIATWAFTLSPFAIFAFGIFSQYDVIGVFFTLWAFNKFLQKKLVQFAILIGIAISFKFFAALLFLPLVLLASKKLLEIIKLGLIASLPLVVQLALYWSNESFRNQIFSLAGGKAGGAATSGVLNVVALLYLVVCLASFFSTRWPGTFEQKAVLFSVAAYGLMFSAVVWHPQWLIILTPFLALMVSMISIPRTWLLWELVAFISFIGFTVNSWKSNVDGAMIERGPLAPYVPQAKVLMADFYPDELVKTFQSIMVVFFLAPSILLLIEIFRRPQSQEVVRGFTWSSRAVVPWIAFVMPAFLAIYIPMDIATALNRSAPVSGMQKEILSEASGVPVPEISSGTEISQTFVVKGNDFSAVGIQLATYARQNAGLVSFSISDDNGSVIHSKSVDINEIEDNAWFYLVFVPQSNSIGREYSLRITSDSKPGFAITAWASLEDSILEGSLNVNGLAQKGDLSLYVFYKSAP